MNYSNNKESSREPVDNTEDDDNSVYTLQREISKYMDVSNSTFHHEQYPGVERINYDFTEERQRISIWPTNLIESTAHLIKGCLGAGIFAIHVGFKEGGLWLSLGAAVFIGLLITYSMFILVKSAQKMYVRLRVARLSYPDLAEVSLATGPLQSFRRYSKAFRYTVDLCLFSELCGACCIYQIMIAQIMKQVLETSSWMPSSWHLDVRIYILIVTIPLLMLCMIRSLKYLSPLSLVADCIIGICVLIMIYHSLSKVPKITERPSWKSWQGFFYFCGIFVFSTDGVGVALPIENNMKAPKYFSTVMEIGMSFVVTSVIIVGFFGYWAYGENCISPSVLDLPNQNFTMVIQILLALTLVPTFALNFWVPVKVVWRYLGKKFKRKRGYWERLYRAIHILLLTIVSVLCYDAGDMMFFLGDVLIALTAFVFPAFIEILVTWKDRRRGRMRWTLIKDIIIMMFGLALNLGAFFSYWY